MKWLFQTGELVDSHLHAALLASAVQVIGSLLGMLRITPSPDLPMKQIGDTVSVLQIDCSIKSCTAIHTLQALYEEPGHVLRMPVTDGPSHAMRGNPLQRSSSDACAGGYPMQSLLCSSVTTALRLSWLSALQMSEF